MTSIMQALKGYFARNARPVEYDAAANVLRWSVEGEHGEWGCVAVAREDERQLLVYSFCSLMAPPAKLPPMAEFVARANAGLAVGNFELDWESGAIRFRTSIDVEGTDLNDALIKNLITVNLVTMDRYLGGILAVLNTGAAPAEILAALEDTSLAEPDA